MITELPEVTVLGSVDNPVASTLPINALSGGYSQDIALFHLLNSQNAYVRLVQIISVNEDKTVNIQPMVGQTDGDGQTIPHGIINNVPVFSLAGGGGAFIITPDAGDIGAAIFCDNDISVVKKSKKPDIAGSYRRNDFADALYLGGFLNTATTYVKITGNRIDMVGQVWMNGKRVDDTHRHDSVQSGSSNSGQVV
jgi:hypothetical protein